MHSEEEEQEIPSSRLFFAPSGSGVDWTVHFLPFQLSASVSPAPALFVK